MKHEHSEGLARGIAGIVGTVLFLIAGFLIVAFLKFCK